MSNKKMLHAFRKSLDEIDDSIAELVDDAGELRLRLCLLENQLQEIERLGGGATPKPGKRPKMSLPRKNRTGRGLK